MFTDAGIAISMLPSLALTRHSFALGISTNRFDPSFACIESLPAVHELSMTARYSVMDA